MEGKKLKLSHEGWGNNFLKDLNHLRLSEVNMCDAKILLAEDETLAAHSCVLASTSPFFKSLLGETEYPEIDMSEFPAEHMRQVLEFIYTGYLEITDYEAPILQSIAETLQINVLEKLSEKVVGSMHEEPPVEAIEVYDELVLHTPDRSPSPPPLDQSFSPVGSPMPTPSPMKKRCQKTGTDEEYFSVKVEVMEQEATQELEEAFGHEDAATILNSISQTVADIDNKDSLLELTSEHAESDPSQPDSGVVFMRNVNRRKGWKTLLETIEFKDTELPEDEHLENRAEESLPEGFYLSSTCLAHAEGEQGVFVTGRLRKTSRFGPFVGRHLDIKDYDEASPNARFCWPIYTNGHLSHYLDGSDQSRTNWMRYIQLAPDPKMQNLEAFQFEGKLFFSTMQDIPAGQELLVRFGNQYSRSLFHLDIPEDERKGFKCEDCDKMYTTELMYWKHRRATHGDAMPIEIYKQMMEQRAANKRARTGVQEEPVDEDAEIFECYLCQRRFKNAQVLQLHAYVHMDKKPFECETCGKGFTQKANLKHHTALHTGEKPHVCTMCGKKFIRKSEMKKHMVRHQKQRTFKCDQCDKGFNDWGNLYRHKMVHTGEKPFKCHVCGKGFSQTANLRSHVKRHTGEKPFKCSACGKCFADSYHFTVHQRRHTGEKPYQCDFCPKAFVDQQGVKAHMKRHKISIKMEEQIIKEVLPEEQSVVNEVESILFSLTNEQM